MRRALLLSVTLVAACVAGPPPNAFTPERPELGREIATVAVSMHGAPYRYGGDTPEGFDCSGLVAYSHGAVGIQVPRTAREQHRAADPVSANRLRSGDLVFFRTRPGSVSHVGVIVEDGRFVHAPSTGKRVVISRLDEKYWRDRVVGYGRFYQ